MITRQELLNASFGGIPKWDDNAKQLLTAVNIIREAYGRPMYPSCFYRSPEWDRAKGRSGKSQHCLNRACDFKDPTGELDEWCLKYLDVLERAGLWLENPAYTRGWCHLDLKSRTNRVFIP